MAGRMVAVPSQCTRRGAGAIALLLSALSACSAFDPVKETRYTLLNSDHYAELDMKDAHWLAYDDQHSRTFSCTNGAAGNHPPEECAQLYSPHFVVDGPKCQGVELTKEFDDPGPIYMDGLLPPMVDCAEDHPAQCLPRNKLDVSNMWGAGVGLAFSLDGKGPWDAKKHKVRGVAFDFIGSDEARSNLRVLIPTVLDATTPILPDRPLMRTDGTVIGTDGKIYGCDSEVVSPSATPLDRSDTTLGDVRPDGGSPEVLTSEQHPDGSAFWQQEATLIWGASPVNAGHNEFEWDHVLPPPGLSPDGRPEHMVSPYQFDKTRILGVHFQVVPCDPANNPPIPFRFSISNLALLEE